MVLELIIALVIGILAGTFTGLCPSIHINLVGALLLGLSASLLHFTSPIILIIFIVAMTITHTFTDFIPSVFLGAPDEDTALSVLPGHELLIQGRGYEAIYLANYGSIIGIIIIILISPLFLLILPKIESLIKIFIPYILIISSIFLISKEQNQVNALIVLLISGFLGIAVLNSNVAQPFLPLLSGLFGVSSLIISIKSKIKIPNQIIKKPNISKKEITMPIFASSIASPLCCFLPGFGSGQATIIGSSLIKAPREKFLILLGATNIIGAGLTFAVLYSIGKTRTGIATITKEIIPTLTLNHLIIITLTIILTGIISFFWTLFLAKRFIKIIQKVNYTKLSYFIILIIFIITFIFSGFLGLFILIISTATGLYGILSNVKRINLMGCLVIPVILIYI